MELMLIVVACYTVCSLSDKHAVARLGFKGNALTFTMAAATAFFMLFYLPFDSRHFEMTWQSFAAILLMAASKMLEFQLAAVILKKMSAFELKAWLGLTLFVSYATDIIKGVYSLSLFKILFIAVTVIGLFLIARSGKKTINYLSILLPLILYLAAKYGYGLIVSLSESYISPTLSLFWALVILTVVLIPFAHPVRLITKKTKGTLFVALTKIPNVIGLVCENLVAVHSMANYSFIQPMILIVLFVIQLIKREECSLLNIIGGVICSVGILGFQLI